MCTQLNHVEKHFRLLSHGSRIVFFAMVHMIMIATVVACIRTLAEQTSERNWPHLGRALKPRGKEAAQARVFDERVNRRGRVQVGAAEVAGRCGRVERNGAMRGRPLVLRALMSVSRVETVESIFRLVVRMESRGRGGGRNRIGADCIRGWRMPTGDTIAAPPFGGNG